MQKYKSPEADKTLINVYKSLYGFFGPQNWWPADTPLEVAVGAILTQNTNWGNVKKAIMNLKINRKLSPHELFQMPEIMLADLIRPSGYYNIKAKRLKNFISLLMREYGGCMETMKKEAMPILRSKLLLVNGIGPETADSILLYACEKAVFVVDAYTKRVFLRHNILTHDLSYEVIQDYFHERLVRDATLFNEYHALLVRLAKEYCRTRPICAGCPLEGV